ncbi:MAG: hypothetical protein ACE5I1_29255, partial [bacterium]
MNEIVYLDPGKVTKDFSKMAIEEKAIKDVIDLVNSGEIDPLKAYVQAKAMTEYLKVFVSELHAN